MCIERKALLTIFVRFSYFSGKARKAAFPRLDKTLKWFRIGFTTTDPAKMRKRG
ncbi:hypothetical protein HMPREF1986_02433 [Oribacterium sp. oral taxon 078 str. F0263]|nr:hypothetical protein HMPREF1986_02433 [Oribacterium sp. oral taxon 078 str. F0263]